MIDGVITLVFPTESQVLLFLASMYGGLIIGLFFDLYRFTRNIFRFGRIATYIGDFIFWLASCAIMLVIVYKSSSGLIRVYQLAGFGMGMITYRKVLSKYVIKLLNLLSFCLASLFYTVLKLIRGPFIVLWRIFCMISYKVRVKVFLPLKGAVNKYIKHFGILLKKN